MATQTTESTSAQQNKSVSTSTNSTNTTETGPSSSADVQPSNQAMMGLQQDGSYKIKFGYGITVPASAFVKGNKADLSQLGLTAPGLRMTEFKKNNGERPSGTLTAALNLPRVNAESKITAKVDEQGEVTSLSGKDIEMNLPALNNPTITKIALSPDKQLSGELKVNSKDFNVGGSTAKLSGTVNLVGKALTGQIDAELGYPNLADGHFSVMFGEGGELSASGRVDMTDPILNGIGAEFAIEQDNLVATVTVPADKLAPPVPGLQVSGGNVTMTSTNGKLSGGLENINFDYKGFANGSITATIADGKLNGEGSFASTISALPDVAGEMQYKDSKFSGKITIESNDFPEALGIKSGSITATLDEQGKMSFSGELAASLGPVGEGKFTASIDGEGSTAIAAEIDVAIAGLQGAKVKVALINGQLEGEGDIPIDPAIMPGLSGAVHIEYKQNLWKGETEFNFEADNGKLSGMVKVGVEQNEENGLNVYGGGSLTMQLSDNIEGTVGAEIDKEGKITLDMNIAVEPLELFPEKRIDKELFSYSQNIPLWAILVAVIRMRAGARAGIGPGQFRNIAVTGTYVIGDPDGPDLDFTGELYIPAFAEGYVAIGAGLGASVVIGSVTGGIEAMATAGIYGAVSVKPLLEYNNGDWTMSGTAIMAAGARFKLSLNAWAEAEAFWVTVWENTWELAEKTWSFGPDLALQFQLQDYVLGSGAVPEITMEDPDIGSVDSMISDAMPKDSPAPSGAKGAIKQQQAEWKGKKQGDAKPPPLDPKQQADASRSPKDDPNAKPPMEVPKKPTSKKQPPPDANKGGKDAKDGKNTDPAKASKETDNKDLKQKPQPNVKPEEEVKDEGPRHPTTITLGILQEPPVSNKRTQPQKQQDLNAAVKVLKLAMEVSNSVDELDDYFGAIQKRFALTEIKLVEGTGGQSVKLKINCTNNVPVNLPASSLKTSTPTFKQKKISNSVGSSDVGIKMTQDVLGPDHKHGSGPSGQKGVMKQLVTDPNRPNPSKYIRGHLLNEKLGGPGTAKNLYPITAEANKAHNLEVEEKIKTKVDTEKKFVYYQVEVTDETISLQDKPDPTTGVIDISQNWINATFSCTAYTLNETTGERDTNIVPDRHPIVSKYVAGAAIEAKDTRPELPTFLVSGLKGTSKTLHGAIEYFVKEVDGLGPKTGDALKDYFKVVPNGGKYGGEHQTLITKLVNKFNGSGQQQMKDKLKAIGYNPGGATTSNDNNTASSNQPESQVQPEDQAQPQGESQPAQQAPVDSQVEPEPQAPAQSQAAPEATPSPQPDTPPPEVTPSTDSVTPTNRAMGQDDLQNNAES